MSTTAYQVIQYTRSPLAQLALRRVQGELDRLIEGGPGETFYDLPVVVKMPDGFTDNDIYAIVATLEHDGWTSVYVCGGILYFNFPPVKGA